MDDAQTLDPAVAVALAWQPAPTRPALAALFALDQRLRGVIARAREPMLAQVRLAWWRDRLAEPARVRPTGEPLLAELSAHWGDGARALIPLVDGWEHLLGEGEADAADFEAFARGRGLALAAFAEAAGEPAAHLAALSAGRWWALADLAAYPPHPGDRPAAQLLGQREPALAILPRALRGVAVLGGLSRRALARGEPLMQGRAAAAAAIRLGMFGR